MTKAFIHNNNKFSDKENLKIIEFMLKNDKENVRKKIYFFDS